jgi:hypothetical protein
MPKEMQHMGEAFYGRMQTLRAALEPLIEAVVRNVYGGRATGIGCAGTSCGLYAGSSTSG